MKKISFWIAVFLMAISGFANATTVLDVNDSLKGFIDGNIYSFNVSQNGTYDATFSVTNSGLSLTLFGIVEKIGSSWVPVGGLASSGSFSFVGNDTLQYRALVGDVNLLGNKVPYSILISGPTPAVPEPETWALLLLGISVVVYQVRPRKMNSSLSVLNY